MGTYNNEKIIQERFVSYIENDVYNARDRLTNDLNYMEELFQYVLYNIDAYDLFSSRPESGEDSYAINSYQFKRDMDSYLSSIIYAKQEFDLVTVQFDNEKTFYFARKEVGQIDTSTIPIDDFSEVMKENNQVEYYFHDDQGSTYMYLLRNIYALDTFEVLAIMSFRMDNEYFLRVVEDIYKDSMENISMYTKDGQMIVDVGNITNENIIQDNKLFQKENGTYEYYLNNDKYYLVIESIENSKLKIVCLVSTDILTADTKKVSSMMIVLCLASMPIYLFLANSMYKQIFSPLNILIHKMSEIEKGDLNTIIDIHRGDEIGKAYDSFNSMSKQLKYLVECIYEEEIARRTAEISALQAQINPHFLYNTLETINWKAQLSGEQDIAHMIQALSKLMDANINRDGDKFISVEKEMQYMDSYLFLIQKRFGDKIKYEKSIDKSLLSSKLPKLIIQPIIENAIHHGIEPLGKGKIKISIYRNDEQLVIQVDDDGQGMTSDEQKSIESIFDNTEYIIKNEKSTNSIGLGNVYKRLVLIYANKAHISIDSTPDKGTTVKLIIPNQQIDQGGNGVV